MEETSDHTATIIDGTAIAHSIRSEIAGEVRLMAQQFGRVPGFAVVSFGNWEGTLNYVNMKKGACDEVGINFFDINLSEQVSESELIQQIHQLNENHHIHGILIQFPLPKHINAENILSEISIEKDIDGFHPLNIGKLGMEGREPLFQPCIPKTIFLFSRANSQLHHLAMAISSAHTATIIDGKAIAHSIRSEITAEVQLMARKFGKVPGFAAVSFGCGEGTLNYVNMKREACDEVGIKFFETNLSDRVSEDELIQRIRELNADSNVHGIVVQYPLPKDVNVEKVLSEISVEKDVDGFHPVNIGKLGMEGREPLFQPCISKGCFELLTRSGISVEGKKAVVVGGSSLVGLPISLLLLKAGATVTIVQPCTTEPRKLICDADIVIAAAGQAMMIKGDWIKPGAAVIDVGNLAALDVDSSWTIGTNYTTTTSSTSTDSYCTSKSVNEPVGDVNFDEACKVAGWITPVPGGVGPVTVAMFLLNTLDSAKRMINN